MTKDDLLSTRGALGNGYQTSSTAKEQFKSFIKRNEDYIGHKEKKIESYRKQRESKDMKECTFKPEVLGDGDRKKGSKKGRTTKRSVKQFIED